MIDTEILERTAKAALYFLDTGQFLFRSVQDTGAVTTKYLNMRDVQAAFRGNSEDSGWLPPGILQHGYSTGGPWYFCRFAPQVVTIQLNGTDETLSIPIPGTILIGHGGNHFMFAYRGKLQPSSGLYKAPFPNVHSDGRICFGNNQPPEVDMQNAERAWKLFFSSPFNADLTDGKSIKHPKDVTELLREIAGRKQFPERDLVPHWMRLNVISLERLS